MSRVTRSLGLLVLALAAQGSALSCKKLTIPVSLENVSVKPLFDLGLTAANLTQDFISHVAEIPSIALNAHQEYAIAATFCEPAVRIASRHNTLQILQHGAGYDRTYWSGLGLGNDRISWVAYAASQGYPTLAIDRLCNGNSSHPSGLLCQIPSAAGVLHQISQMARSGRLSLRSSSRAFDRLILVGQSIGSDIVSLNAGLNPSDADAIVLCGWSNQVGKGFLSTLYGPIALASATYPDRYASLGPAYLTFGSETGQRYLSYFGDYDPAVSHYDYSTQGTFTLGEALTAFVAQAPSPAFKGLVVLVDGNEDPTYCQPTYTSVLNMSKGNCSAGAAAGSRSNFPNARSYNYHITQNTGHSLHLHRTAQESFRYAHGILNSEGF